MRACVLGRRLRVCEQSVLSIACLNFCQLYNCSSLRDEDELIGS